MVCNFRLRLPQDKNVWNLEKELESLFDKFNFKHASGGGFYNVRYQLYKTADKGTVILSDSDIVTDSFHDGNVTLLGFNENSGYFKGLKQELKEALKEYICK